VEEAAENAIFGVIWLGPLVRCGGKRAVEGITFTKSVLINILCSKGQYGGQMSRRTPNYKNDLCIFTNKRRRATHCPMLRP